MASLKVETQVNKPHVEASELKKPGRKLGVKVQKPEVHTINNGIYFDRRSHGAARTEQSRDCI